MLTLTFLQNYPVHLSTSHYNNVQVLTVQICLPATTIVQILTVQVSSGHHVTVLASNSVTRGPRTLNILGES